MNGIIYIRNWIRTNGEMSEDGKSITYSCQELEDVIKQALSQHDVIKNEVAVCDPHGCLNYSQGYDRCKKQCERCKDL
jgi:hypothetical protein